MTNLDDFLNALAGQQPFPTDIARMTHRQRQDLAGILAMIVRNGMEDLHAESIPDDVMAELNPIIRNGILSGLDALANGHTMYLAFAKMLIPEYWEPAEFLDDYREYLEGGNWK